MFGVGVREGDRGGSPENGHASLTPDVVSSVHPSDTSLALLRILKRHLGRLCRGPDSIREAARLDDHVPWLGAEIPDGAESLAGQEGREEEGHGVPCGKEPRGDLGPVHAAAEAPVAFAAVEALPLLADGRGVDGVEAPVIEVEPRHQAQGNGHVQDGLRDQPRWAAPRHPQEPGPDLEAGESHERSSGCHGRLGRGTPQLVELGIQPLRLLPVGPAEAAVGAPVLVVVNAAQAEEARVAAGVVVGDRAADEDEQGEEELEELAEGCGGRKRSAHHVSRSGCGQDRAQPAGRWDRDAQGCHSRTIR